MSLFVKIIKQSNAAWEKPKILLDEESLQQREIAYDEKLKKQIQIIDTNMQVEMKDDEEDEEEDVEEIDDYADDLQAQVDI
ncbi:hypothetical protein pb186bvf_000554 [Paramecium bursaria]